MESMATHEKSLTYRVRQLPHHVDRLQAGAVLLRVEPRLGPPGNISIPSLAANSNPWEIPPTRTATIMFQKRPRFLEKGNSEWKLPAKDAGLKSDIIIDSHFLDVTVLNDPSSDYYGLE